MVKDAFHDKDFRDRVQLGAVNSINWARVLAQITYYFYSWFRVTDGLRSHADSNLSVNYVVPTGNFGNVLAGYYAKLMGLPIDKLVLATNANDVLHRFVATGEYRHQHTRATIAPSMDVSVSSNFERYLFYLAGEDTALVRTWMETFETTGSLTVPEQYLQKVRTEFLSWSSSKSEIIDTMRNVYEKHHYLICPHTAAAAAAARRHRLDPAHTVVLATAHPAKFEDTVLLACPHHVLPPRPDILMEVFDRPVRKTLLPPALDDIELFIKTRVIEQEAASTHEALARGGRKTNSATSSGWSSAMWWASVTIGAAAAAGAAFFVLRHHEQIRRLLRR